VKGFIPIASIYWLRDCSAVISFDTLTHAPRTKHLDNTRNHTVSTVINVVLLTATNNFCALPCSFVRQSAKVEYVTMKYDRICLREIWQRPQSCRMDSKWAVLPTLEKNYTLKRRT